MNNIQKAFRDKGRLGLRQAQNMADGGVVMSPDEQRRARLRAQAEADAELERQEAAKRAPVAPVIRSPAVPPPAAPPPVVAPVPIAPAVVAPVRAAPMGNQEVINRRLRDAGLRKGGVVPGHDTSGSDDVPVNLTRGEGVLPVETVDALGGPAVIEHLIEATTGEKPKAGLRAGGKYELGLTTPTSVSRDALDVARRRLGAQTASAGSDAMAEAAQAARGINAGGGAPASAAVAAENARNAQAALDATQRLGASSEGAGLRAAAPAAAGPSRVGSLVKGGLALAPVIGAAQAAVDSPANVAALGNSIGVDTATRGGKGVANTVNTLAKTGDAATFGLAGRYGQALADEAANGPPTLATPLKAAWNTGAGLREGAAKWWNSPVKPAAAAAPAAQVAAQVAAQPAVASPAVPASGVPSVPAPAGMQSGTGTITNNSTGKVTALDTRGMPARPPVDMNDYSRPVGLAAGAPAQDNMPSGSDTWDDMWRKKAGRAQDREGLRAATARYTADSSAAAHRYGADTAASTSRANAADTLAGHKYAADSTAKNAAATVQRQAENDNVKRIDDTIKNLYPVTDDKKDSARPAQEAARASFQKRFHTTLGNMGVPPEKVSHAGLVALTKLSSQADDVTAAQGGIWQSLRRIVGVSSPQVTDDDLRNYIITGVDNTGLINNRFKGSFGDVEQGPVVGGPGVLGTGVTRGGRVRDVNDQLKGIR